MSAAEIDPAPVGSKPDTPTPEQAAAIAARGHDVLLEAGAGTGKTGTMVERYCRLVCEEGVPPDAVLAFTFTEKAAAELRQRIRAALARRATAGSERGAELLAGIGAAWVTTIHGFCNRLLAAHPVAAGIDPRFRVVDEVEAGRLAREAFDEALEEFLAGEDRGRERTVAAYEIGGLRAIVVAAYAELRSRGVPRPRLPEPVAPDPPAALRRAAAAAAEALEELKPTNSNRALLERALEALEGDGEPGLDQLTALRTKSRAVALAAYREASEAVVSAAAEAGEGGEAYGHVAELVRLFGERYAAAKEGRAAVDFEDLQILAAGLLEGTEIGESYRGRFRHVLVDEFQDTNRLQLRLVEALRGPDTEAMAVGDELQSIYGFRHADLDVFRERRAAVEADPETEAMALSGNFRSRPEVIEAVNALGEILLGDKYRPLRLGAPDAAPAAPPDPGPAVSLLLTARDGWDEEGIELEPATDATTPLNRLAEARFLAARLRELADAGVERGEMVVLLRAFTHLDAYEDSLERAGLRPYVVGGRGYWSQQQVADVRALLATIANPLDDQALFGALASPACGALPDTLWLLRGAAGRGRHIWPALARLADLDPEAEVDAGRLEEIAPAERELLRRFAATLVDLRKRAPRLPLAELIDTAVGATGYDLAVLGHPAGEARFANLRKLMRLAAEFEGREGRDLRGLLDFLATRAEADVEAQAATSVEGHDGVRIMTVHSAKGLEFGTVAVPGLSRRLLAGGRAPLLELGREPDEPRVGMQLRRLGAGSIDLYRYKALREEAQEREAEEELRLFHVAATRARERLVLSGVIKPEGGGGNGPGKPIVERIADGLGLDRKSETTIEPAGIAASLNLPSPERAAELRARRSEPETTPDLGQGPAPLAGRSPPAVPRRPLSYTALAAYVDCPYRFQLERVLGLPARGCTSVRYADRSATTGENERGLRTSRGGVAHGAAVHSLLEWSGANGWREPHAELVRAHAVANGLDGEGTEALLAPVRAWLGSALLRERVMAAGASAHTEAPLLLGAGGTVLRGSIDLLVEREGGPPLVIDYKTDRLDGDDPAVRAAKYETQRSIYALAVAESRGAAEIEVAYVFLERPEEPDIRTLGPAEMDAGRARLEATIARIAAGEFPPAPPEHRNHTLCDGCPALNRLCSGPEGT